jgi:hypothetical protein
VADLIQHVAEILSSASVATTSSTGTWRIVGRDFIEGTQVSTTEGAQIVITPTGGFGREINARLDRPTFQIRVIAPSTGSTGLDLGTDNKLADIVGALNNFNGTLSDGWPYISIDLRNGPLYLGRDENQRPMYSMNFEVIRADSPEILFEWTPGAGVGNGTFARVTSTSAPASYAVSTPSEQWGTLTTAKSGEARVEWVST